MKAMRGIRPECVTVQKKLSRGRAMAAYEVKDKPSTLKADDWDRVVAVFVLGKEWQFKEWPFKDHVEIFNKFSGFFMRLEDDSVESAKKAKQWNVKIILISKNKRHKTELLYLRCGIGLKSSCGHVHIDYFMYKEYFRKLYLREQMVVYDLASWALDLVILKQFYSSLVCLIQLFIR